jgi:hypothetical protein
MSKNLLPQGRNAIYCLYFLASIVFFLALVHNHYQIITYPIPLDANEAVMPTVTATIAAGENPNSFESQPARFSVYPVLYNIIVAPFSSVFGNTLQLHRAIAGIFILASCLLLFLVAYRSGGSAVNSFAAATLVYAGLLFYSTPIASVNSTGLFLFLTSIIIPWLYGFSNRSLVAALIFGVLSFYGKQYFIACLGYIALYLFIAISKKTAIIFGICSLLLFLASLALVNLASPYFIDDTIFAVKVSTAWIASNQTMEKQLLDFGKIYLPILAILAVQVMRKVYANEPTQELDQKIGSDTGALKFVNLTDLDAPLFSREPDYIWFCFACSLSIIVFGLGKNPGNYLTYLFQLISPFFLVGCFVGISRTSNFKWLYQILAILAFYNSYAMLSHDFSVDEKNWHKLSQRISKAKNIYGSPIVLMEILANGGQIYQNGQTVYFPFAKDKPAFFEKPNPDESVDAIWGKYVNLINTKVENQEFDLIVLDAWTHLPIPIADLYSTMNDKNPVETLIMNQIVNDTARLKDRYRLSEVINISLANRPGGGKYAMNVWEPIRKPGQSNITEP